MKKATKISIQKIAELTKTPAFWHSFQFTHGSYKAAAKKMKLDPSILRELGKERSRFEPPIEVSDARLIKLQKGLKRIDARDVKTAHQFIYTSGSMTPGQIAYARRYTKRGEKEQAFFRKSVRNYYNNETKRVHMGAISEAGKVYDPNAEHYKRQKQIRERPRKRATKIARERLGKRAIRRSRRGRNR